MLSNRTRNRATRIELRSPGTAGSFVGIRYAEKGYANASGRGSPWAAKSASDPSRSPATRARYSSIVSSRPSLREPLALGQERAVPPAARRDQAVALAGVAAELEAAARLHRRDLGPVEVVGLVPGDVARDQHDRGAHPEPAQDRVGIDPRALRAVVERDQDGVRRERPRAAGQVGDRPLEPHRVIAERVERGHLGRERPRRHRVDVVRPRREVVVAEDEHAASVREGDRQRGDDRDRDVHLGREAVDARLAGPPVRGTGHRDAGGGQAHSEGPHRGACERGPDHAPNSRIRPRVTTIRYSTTTSTATRSWTAIAAGRRRRLGYALSLSPTPVSAASARSTRAASRRAPPT